MQDTPYFDPGSLDESKAYYNVMPEGEIVMETTKKNRKPIKTVIIDKKIQTL